MFFNTSKPAKKRGSIFLYCQETSLPSHFVFCPLCVTSVITNALNKQGAVESSRSESIQTTCLSELLLLNKATFFSWAVNGSCKAVRLLASFWSLLRIVHEPYQSGSWLEYPSFQFSISNTASTEWCLSTNWTETDGNPLTRQCP